MARTLILCALFTAWPSVSVAQAPADARETVVRLTVQPMAAPRPALKYQLLPELREMNPGNPILGYLKCFMEQQVFFHDRSVIEEREKWLAAPLQDLPVKELRDYGGGALRRADAAARLDMPDWQILLKAKQEGVRLLLPEVQELRSLAGALKVRFRGEVADRRFDDAITTAKTLFALSRHLGEHPTHIGELVAVAIAMIGLGPVEEMIQQPGCPNLYWALTDLPKPFIDLRKGMQGVRLIVDAEFPDVDATAPMSPAQLKKAVARIDETLKYVEEITKQSVRDWLEKRASDEAHVRAARKRLVEAGLPEKQVKEFPTLQVVLLDEKHASEAKMDERLKWMSLPYWQVEAATPAAAAPESADDTLFAKLVLPSIKIKNAQARLDQRISLLCHVEAIRMYAAEHDGKVPAQLSDIKLPLPVDPFTGKAFPYQVEGQDAVLRGSPPRGFEASAVYNLRFVVTIKK